MQIRFSISHNINIFTQNKEFLEFNISSVFISVIGRSAKELNTVIDVFGFTVDYHVCKRKSKFIE